MLVEPALERDLWLDCQEVGTECAVRGGDGSSTLEARVLPVVLHVLVLVAERARAHCQQCEGGEHSDDGAEDGDPLE